MVIQDLIIKTGPDIVIISCYCCRQAQQPVLFCKHSSDPEKSVQYLCNIIVITQIVCTFLLNGGMTKTDQPVPRLCCCFHYTHLGPLCPLSRGKICFLTTSPPEISVLQRCQLTCIHLYMSISDFSESCTFVISDQLAT